MLIGQKITVVGAGIGGLAVSTALAQRGARVTVLEQADVLREVGAGLQISPNGVAVLRELGLGPDLARIAVKAESVCLKDYRAGKSVVTLDLRDAAGDYYFVHRSDLIQLLGGAARAAGVKLRMLHQVDTVDLSASPIAVSTSAGARCKSAVLIGADGLHSRIRHALNGDRPPFFTGQVAWRCTVPVDAPVARQVRVYMGPGRHLVCYPLRDRRLLNVVAVEERAEWVEESWSHRDDPDHLRAAFAGFAPEVQDLLARAQEAHIWGLFRHPVAKAWHADGAAILGDAAHPTLPFMAQGANMALEDAWVLAQSMANHSDTTTAFARYQAARHARCTRIVGAASKNARNYHLKFPPLRFAAHSALRAVGALAPRQMLRRFDWLYGVDVTQQDV